MSSRVVHRLTGYDRTTEFLTIEYDIPTKKFARIRKIAGVGPDDPEAIGSYPLDRNQVQKISDLLGSKVEIDRFDYFVEAFSED
jgi:hypothetical protein